MIIHGDALEEMKKMEDNAVDLVLTDAPWDDWEIEKTDPIPFFEEMRRVSKNQIIGTIENYPKVWTSPNSFCVLRFSGYPLYFATSYDRDYVVFNVKKELTEFKGKEDFKTRILTVVSVKALIDYYTSETDIVFDPFAGSGTTLVAAKKSGRKFIGCERILDRCEFISRRLL